VRRGLGAKLGKGGGAGAPAAEIPGLRLEGGSGQRSNAPAASADSSPQVTVFTRTGVGKEDRESMYAAMTKGHWEAKDPDYEYEGIWPSGLHIN
jgi:hypothetical protein